MFLSCRFIRGDRPLSVSLGTVGTRHSCPHGGSVMKGPSGHLWLENDKPLIVSKKPTTTWSRPICNLTNRRPLCNLTNRRPQGFSDMSAGLPFSKPVLRGSPGFEAHGADGYAWRGRHVEPVGRLQFPTEGQSGNAGSPTLGPKSQKNIFLLQNPGNNPGTQNTKINSFMFLKEPDRVLVSSAPS